MNRRQLFAALAVVAFAPDELWTPSRKIFLPPRGGWRPNLMPGGLYGARRGDE